MNSSLQEDPTQADQRRQVASDVRFRPVFDEGVVIRQRAAEVLVLNQVGLRILELLSEEKATGQIAEALAGEFDATREQLLADVGDFLAQLEEAGVVEPIAPERADDSPATERSPSEDSAGELAKP